MTGYSKVNLAEVNNASATEGNEARFSRQLLGSKEIGVSLFRWRPNYRAARAHKHRVQEEVYVVLKGSGQMLLDGKIEALKIWDTLRVAPDTLRAFKAGPEGLEILAIGGRKPAEGDAEMMEANWPAD